MEPLDDNIFDEQERERQEALFSQIQTRKSQEQAFAEIQARQTQEPGVAVDDIEQDLGFFTKNLDRLEGLFRGGMNVISGAVRSAPVAGEFMSMAPVTPGGVVNLGKGVATNFESLVKTAKETASREGITEPLAGIVEKLTPKRAEGLEDDVLSDIFEGIGSTLAFGVVGLLAGPAGVIGAGASVGVEEALGSLTPEERVDSAAVMKATTAGMLSGFTEAVPVGRAQRLISKVVKPRVAKALVEGLVLEGGQETLQTFMINLGVQSRAADEGLFDAAVVGGASGLVLNAVAMALGARRRGGEVEEAEAPAETAEEEPFTQELTEENLAKSVEEIRKVVQDFKSGDLDKSTEALVRLTDLLPAGVGLGGNTPSSKKVDVFEMSEEELLDYVMAVQIGVQAKMEAETETKEEEAAETETPDLSVGDAVQWVSGGVEQFAEGPKRIVGFGEFEGREFAFVEGETTGIPLEELETRRPEPLRTPKEAADFMEQNLKGPATLDEVDGRHLLSMDFMRQALGLQRQGTEESGWAKAVQWVLDSNADAEALDLATEILNEERGFKTDKERFTLLVRAAKIYNQRDQLDIQIEAAEAEGGVEAKEEAQHYLTRRDKLNAQIAHLSNAEGMALSQTGRALASANAAIDRFEFEPVKVLSEAEKRKGASLDPEEETSLRGQAEELQKKFRKVESEREKNLEELKKERKEKVEKILAEESERKAKGSEIQKEIDKAREELRKLGFEIHAGLDIPPRVAFHLGKIARAYVRKGVNNIPDLVVKMQTHLPGMDQENVTDALLASDPARKVQRDKLAEARLRNLKTQASLLQQLGDAEKGLFRIPEKRETPEEIQSIQEVNKKLRGLLADLKESFFEATDDPAHLQMAVNRIDQLQTELDKRFGERAVLDSGAEPASLKEALDKVKDLEREMKVREKTAEIERKLQENDIALPEEVEERPKSQSLQQAEIELKIAKREMRAAIAAKRPFRLWSRDGALEIAALPRTLMATADMSSFLRQGLVLSLSHPVHGGRAIKEGFKAFWNKNSAEMVDYQLENHPLRWLMEKHGLYIAPLDSARFSSREEYFQSRLLQKIPLVGSILSDPIRRSERTFVTNLNMLRVNIFAEYAQKHMTGETKMSERELTVLAKYLNAASGRGNISPKLANGLNGLMFSPRFTASRFETPYRMAQMMLKYPHLRKEAAKGFGAFALWAVGMLSLADLVGMDVGLDPEDSDFGKIIFGRTRVDVFGGLQQPISFVLRLALGSQFGDPEEAKQHLSGTDDLIWRFLRFRAHPSISAAIEAISGENVVGEKVGLFEPFERNILLTKITPLWIQDLQEAIKANGFVKGGALGASTFFGTATTTFDRELTAGDLKPILKKIDYFPQGPRYPKWIGENKKEQLERIFDEQTAYRFRMMKPLLTALPPEIAKQEAQFIAAEVRAEVRAMGGF